MSLDASNFIDTSKEAQMDDDKRAVRVLISKAASTTRPEDAVLFAQAVLNAANALWSLQGQGSND